jgi:hypothetical protein
VPAAFVPDLVADLVAHGVGGASDRVAHASALAQATALARTSGGRLARAGGVLLRLQSELGNRHVQRVVHHARRAVAEAPVIQPSPVVGPPNDRYEREADQVAQGAVGHSAPRAAERHGGTRQPGPPSPAARRSLPEGVAGRARDPLTEAIRGAKPGRPLPEDVRASMELVLGADLGDVRLHTDTRADALARVLGARAFTTGREIFFRRGEYGPDSPAGNACWPMSGPIPHSRRPQRPPPRPA